MGWDWTARAREILARERGSLVSDWGGSTPVALAFPNSYYVGMSSLGYQTLYRLMNHTPGLVCERVFYEYDSQTRRDAQEPLLSLESQRGMDEFAALGFSLSFETDYLNMIEMLHRASIPPLAEERDDTYPLLLGGGPAVSANPGPAAPILDAIVIGEVEGIYSSLSDVLRHALGASKKELLARLADIPGTYVPQLQASVDHSVERQWVRDLDSYPTHSMVLTPDTEFADMYLIEMGRGCRRGCRFCLARAICSPARERSIDVILEQAAEGLQYTDRIGLVSAAVSDHSQVDALATQLREMGARISVSSLRADSLTVPLLQALADSGTHTLTVAPEAGSQRLRDVILKGLSGDKILHAIEMAAAFDFAQLKMYFMVGLPTETDDDIADIIALSRQAAARFQRNVTIQLTPFVPKAHTAFEREAMTEPTTLERRIATVTGELRRDGIAVRSESVRWAQVQGTLARGDGRLGRALATLEKPSLGSWRRALKRAKLEAAEYLRARDADEMLPWSIVDNGSGHRLMSR